MERGLADILKEMAFARSEQLRQRILANVRSAFGPSEIFGAIQQLQTQDPVAGNLAGGVMDRFQQSNPLVGIAGTEQHPTALGNLLKGLR